MFKNLKAKAKIIYFNFINDMIFFLGKQKRNYEKENNKSILNLEDLTPFLSDNDNNEISQTYLDSLKWGILNDKVKNIAISGSFGTGKSTIINLFKYKNPDFKTIDINLGKFEEKNKQTEVDIETSIVQQILYFEKKGKLTESRFERITVKKYILIKALFLIFWVYSILYLFFDKVYNKLLIVDLKFISYNLYELFIKAIFLIISAIIIKNIFNQISDLKLNKLSFNDAEFVPKTNDISIINKHIDELLYFFEKTKTQIVFIEDIDRFEDAVDVFIKLRELNILINNSKDIDEVVTFVYAVKDELFSKNNEKTKFFDLIIPVIPVIDYSNSNTQFLKKLRKDFIDTNILSENIIFNISPYINDMRTLINIINEFKIYYKIKTLKTSLDAEKLFGLIILKNIYPIDFKELQNRSGIVFNIFNKKHELIKKELEINEKKIENLEAYIENSEYEKIDDVLTLRKIYIFELIKLMPNAKCIVDDKITFANVIEDKNFDKLTKSEIIYYSENNLYWNSYKINSGKTFKDVEKLVDKQFSYKERETFVLNNNKYSRENTKRKISLLQSENSVLEKKDFHELFEDIGIDKANNYFNNIIKEKFPENHPQITETPENYNLLKVLVLNNYVNENYSEYISLFYPESLTLNDYNLKLKIIENKEQPFDSEVQNPYKLISELAINNFTKIAILNYHILDYLLITKQSLQYDYTIINKFNEFIKIISSDIDSRILNFINGYIVHIYKNNDLLEAFTTEMSNWKLFWSTIYSNGNKDVKQIMFEELITSKNIEKSKLKSLNFENTFDLYINENNDFLSNIHGKMEPQELISKLKYLGIKLNKIKYNNELFEELIEIEKQNLYKINKENISLILDKFNNNQISIDRKKSNYTYILKSDCENLKTNIENNINEYVEQVILQSENNTEEELQYIIQLLNNENISDENKILLIKKMNFKVKNIQDLQDKNLWKSLISENKLIANWQNLLVEYENDIIGDFSYFENFLNDEQNSIILSQVKLNEELLNNLSNEEENDDDDDREENVDKKNIIHIDSKTVEKFSLDIINSIINDTSFNNLVKSVINKFDVSEIKRKERISILIDNDLINFNSQNIKELDQYNRIYFIEKNEELVHGNYKFFTNLDITTWTNIFKADINAQYKHEILKYLVDEQKLNKNDLDFIKIIIDNFNNLKFHLYSKYFTTVTLESNLSYAEKVNFLANEISEHYSDDEIFNYLDLLGERFSKISRREEFDIEYSLYNEKIVRKLQERNLLKASFSKKNKIIKITYNQE